MTEVKTIIPARLKSGVVNGYVTGAADIIDDDKAMSQAAINAAVDTEIGDDSTEGSIKGRIKGLETLVGPTSVDSQIDAKINALDATKSQAAGADGLALSITETDGKITSISGSIAANTYDASGAAATVKTELLGDAASNYNTLGKLEDAIQAEATTRGGETGALDGRLDTVEGKIPSAATSTNQLADKAFVNSSISTATAEYRGNYNSVTDLNLSVSATHAQIATALGTEVSGADNNDYCFVQIPTADATPTQIAKIERYKYNGTAWSYEYELNNSGFTSDQWAAINSGITSNLVTAFGNKYDKPSTGIPSTDMTSDVQTSLGKADSAYQKPSGGIPDSDLASAVQTSLGKADTAYQKPSGGIPASDLASGVIPDVSGKAEKSEMSVVDGTGTDSDKTTITLKTGTSATVLKSHQSLSGKQDVIDSSHKLSADLVDDTSTTNKFTNATEKQTWNGKQDALTFNTTPSASNKVATMADMPTAMSASGTGHKGGLVPDPGATAGTAKYLREDGTWQVPEGSGGSDTDINYDTTNKKITKTVDNVTSDVVTAATLVSDGGGIEVEVGDTAPVEDVKLFVDEDADPAVVLDVYTRYEIDQKLAFSYDSTTKGLVFPTDTSIVEYDSANHAIVFHG